VSGRIVFETFRSKSDEPAPGCERQFAAGFFGSPDRNKQGFIPIPFQKRNASRARIGQAWSAFLIEFFAARKPSKASAAFCKN